MCDLLRRLKRKLEIFRGCRLPSFDGFCGRHPVERIVDLDTIKPDRIVRKELLFGETHGIEDRFPFFVAETGSTEPDCRHSGIIAQSVFKTPVNIGWPWPSSRKTRENGGFLRFLRALFNSGAGDRNRGNPL